MDKLSMYLPQHRDGITRRRFLGVAAGAALLAGCSRKSARVIPGEIVGANLARGHRVIDGNFPPAAAGENHETAIIGGGIAGLAAARTLAKHGRSDFVVLELEDHAGGNSSHGANAVSEYPWGAHYVSLPSSDSREVIQLYEELGLITGHDAGGRPIYEETALVADPAERLWMYGRWQEGLIPKIGATDADQREYAAFTAKTAHFKAARGRDGKRAFTIPVDRSSRDEEFTSLDRVSMAQWCEAQGFRSEKLRWYIDYACRDDFGGSIDQVSAWAGLHYFAARDGVAANAENDVVLTWPEGNGWLEKKLREPVADRVRTGLMVTRVEPAPEGGVQIDAFDFRSERSVRFETRAAIICVPRFVARRVCAPLRDRPPENLEYGPWVVANLTLDEPLGGHGFAAAWDNVFYDSRSLGYVNARHQRLERAAGPTVITWYSALCDGPVAEERAKARDRAHAAWCDLILADLRRVHPEIDALVRRVDVCVWGHGMVRPTPGLLWSEARQSMRDPFGPIHFAHSDISGLSIFEEAYTNGVLAADAVAAQLIPA